MADLAKLVVRLEAQSAQLVQELEKANRTVAKFASETHKTLQRWAGGLIATFSARAILNFSQDVLKAQGDLVGMAQTAGESVENVSRLGYAADQSGSSLDTLTKSLGSLADRAAEAGEKGGSAAAGFDKLGISVKNNDGTLKSSSDLLLEIADQFAQYEDGTAKAALANDLFGKSGRELIPLLNKGADGIKELTEQADALGITVSTQAAQGANDFGDSLNTLGAITRGVVGQALTEVVPILQGFADDMVTTAESSNRLNDTARILAAGFKLLISAGVIVGEVFDRLGDAIGAAAAAVVAVAQGEFKRAWDIMNDNSEQAKESAQQAADDLYHIWEDTGTRIVGAAQQTDQQLKKTLAFGGNASGLEEVKVGVSKIEKSATEQFYADLNELTKTQSEVALAAYSEQKAALEELYAAGRISLDQYNARLTESLDELLPEFQVTVKKITDTAQSTISEFDKAVAQNTVDIIAGALKDGFDDGAKGILRAFAEMLRDLAAQALAADIGKKIFGDSTASSASGGGGGGWWGALLNAAGSFFGGGAAEGRQHVSAGTEIEVGERGPERFIPDTPGRIVPMQDMVSAPKVEIPLSIANVDDPERIPNYFKSARGGRMFINLLTENASTVRQIMQGA